MFVVQHLNETLEINTYITIFDDNGGYAVDGGNFQYKNIQAIEKMVNTWKRRVPSYSKAIFKKKIFKF